MSNAKHAVAKLIERAESCNSAQNAEAARYATEAVALAVMAQAEILEGIAEALQRQSPRLIGVRETLDQVILDLRNPRHRHGCTGIPSGVDTDWVEAVTKTLEVLRSTI